MSSSNFLTSAAIHGVFFCNQAGASVLGVMIARLANKMQPGSLVKNMPDALMSWSEFEVTFLDPLGPYECEGSEMRNLLRRVGSYISKGRRLGLARAIALCMRRHFRLSDRARF